MKIRLSIFSTLLFLFPICVSASPPYLPKDALPLPIIRQATNYSCGVASLLSILYYWKVYDGNENSLYKKLNTTPEDGTDPRKIVKVAGSFNLQTELKTNLTISDLRTFLQSGSTVILDIQAWIEEDTKNISWKDRWEDGHYVVIIALDDEYAYFMDPSAGPSYAFMPLRELNERWHDYEDRSGVREEFEHLGIIISGKNPLRKFPAPLIKLD